MTKISEVSKGASRPLLQLAGGLTKRWKDERDSERYRRDVSIYGGQGLEET